MAGTAGLCQGVEAEVVKGLVTEYKTLHDDSHAKGGVEARSSQYQTLVSAFYSLVTDLYELGWGPCFHFSTRYRSENFSAAIARHEHYLALRMNLTKDDRVLDVGCGVGGPMSNICRFVGCKIVGVNISEYHEKRWKVHSQKAGGVVAANCQFVRADFHHIPFPDASFDHAYQIEAACHSPARVKLYTEIFRCLKPGGYFSGYEWVFTDKYDPENPTHKEIKKNIEEGNGLPDIDTAEKIPGMLKEAGFEVIEIRDIAPETDIPWYDLMEPKYTSISNFQFTPIGRWVCGKFLRSMEKLKLTPVGTAEVSDVLMKAAKGLADGGREGIFTPMLFVLARKPL